MLCSCEGSCGSGKYLKDLQDLGYEMKFNDNFKVLAEFSNALGSKERFQD